MDRPELTMEDYQILWVSFECARNHHYNCAEIEPTCACLCHEVEMDDEEVSTTDAMMRGAW